MEAASSSEWVVLGSWESSGSSVFCWWIPQAGRILSPRLGSVDYGYSYGVMATVGWYTPTCTAQQHSLTDVPGHVLQASFHTNQPIPSSLCGADYPHQYIGLLHYHVHTPPEYSSITTHPMGLSLQSVAQVLEPICHLDYLNLF